MKRLTTEDFIKRAEAKFGKQYDYSITEYVNRRTKLCYICKKHGKQEQLPENHIRYGCCSCGKEEGYKKLRLSLKELIEQFKKVHGDKFDYSLAEYKNIDTYIKIKCNKCGTIFEQSPYEHRKSKNPCPSCNGSFRTTEDFIKDAKLIHGDKYDYSLVEYIDSKTKVIIKCNKCGNIFYQTYNNHVLQKQNCPVCNTSKGEDFINKILNKKNIQYKRQKRFKECRDKKPLPFDFYLPELSTCIEFDGVEHYKDVYYNGKTSNLKNIQFHDKIKDEFCKNNNLKLIRIPYWEIDNIEKILNEHF